MLRDAATYAGADLVAAKREHNSARRGRRRRCAAGGGAAAADAEHQLKATLNNTRADSGAAPATLQRKVQVWPPISSFIVEGSLELVLNFCCIARREL
jgi:hypothetical protein